MPEHLKNTPESEEFEQYLHNFVNQREREHRGRVVREIAAAVSLMIAG